MHAEAVWREAQAALLDHLRRGEPGHALQRLARGLAHGLDRPVGLFAAAPEGAASTPFWLGGAQADAATLRARGQRLLLQQSGEPVGELRVMPPAGDPADSADPATPVPEALATQLAPITEAAAGLLAAWREQQAQALPTALTLTRAALRESGTFVWHWDVPSDVLDDIDEGALMLGYQPHEIGHTQADWSRLIHPDDAQQADADFERHVRGESPLYRTVYRARMADGRWRWLEERGRIVERDAQGRPTRMVGTQADASIEKALEQARRDQWTAEAANAAKTQFLSRVSHELRTPLNAVLGFSQLLEMDRQQPLSASQRRQVGLIRQAGQHLLAMIGDLLDISLVESGKLAVQAQRVPLAPLLAECLTLVRADAEAAGVALQMDLAAAVRPGVPVDLHPAAQADPTRLRQVVLNLLGNAVKYNRKGGQVRLVLRPVATEAPPYDEPPAAQLAVEVHDTGVGIAPEQMSRLFQPFDRLGREHGAVPGAGLGLALSRMLVDAMGGTLTARSDETGSVFVLTLPAAA